VRILRFLDDSAPEIRRLLRALVEAESPSRDPEAQRQVQDLLTDGLRDLGFRVRRRSGHESGGYLLASSASRPRGAPVQVLLGHCDTVWPVGTLAEMPIEIKEGKMLGPGIFDMKAGLVQMIFALRALQQSGLEPEVSPVVLINSDEEIGSVDSRPAIRRLAKVADRVLVLEPAMGPEGKLKTTRKGVGQFTLRIRGLAAHAGLEPEQGISAILELSRLVQHLFELNDPESGLTVNVGTIDGGVRPNVIAPESRAMVDVRVMTQQQGEQIEQAIRALRPQHPDASIEITGGIETPPMEQTPGNRLLWEVAREVGAELGLELQECLAGGGSDGNITSLHAPTLDGLGAVGGGAHAAHEFIDLEHFAERIALVALILSAPPLAIPDP
jgi:glutamate carboxypeptidase